MYSYWRIVAKSVYTLFGPVCFSQNVKGRSLRLQAFALHRSPEVSNHGTLHREDMPYCVMYPRWCPAPNSRLRRFNSKVLSKFFTHQLIEICHLLFDRNRFVWCNIFCMSLRYTPASVPAHIEVTAVRHVETSYENFDRKRDRVDGKDENLIGNNTFHQRRASRLCKHCVAYVKNIALW